MATPPLAPKAQETKNSVQTQAQSKNLPAHFEVEFVGTYYVGKEPKSYSVTVKIPSLGEGKKDGHYRTAALSPKYGFLLKRAIQAKYGSCDYVYTHELINRVYIDAKGTRTKTVNVNPDDAEDSLTLSNMRLPELLSYITENRYPIDTDFYKKTADLRKAIKDYETDKESFLKRQAEEIEEQRIIEDAKQLDV